MNIRSNRSRIIPIVLCLMAAFIAEHFGQFLPAQNWINAQRMTYAPREAGGNFVFVAIDKKSISSIGVWPWPRAVYGQFIDKILQANARDIAFDIDFSSQSNPADDAAFADALDRAEGSVILPAFLDSSAAGAEANHIVSTVPVPQFASRSWLATVNVAPDPDDIVRRFPYGSLIDGKIVASLPSTLAKRDELRTDSFAIDFSIDPSTVETISAIDVLNPEFDTTRLAGKSVVLGAYAVELKDFFITPVRGITSGPMIQILAAETLLQNRGLVDVQPIIPISLLTILLLAGMVFFRPKGLMIQAILLLGIGLAFEIVGFELQAAKALVLPTAAVHFILLLLLVNRAVEELGIRKWLAKLAVTESRNNRQLLEQIIDDSTDAILILDENQKILDMSRTAEDMFQLSPHVTHDGSEVLPGALSVAISNAIFVLKDGADAKVVRGELNLFVGSASTIIEYSVTPSRLESTGKNSSGTQSDFVATVTARDITTERMQQQKLDFISRHDVLTGALRQSEFVQRLEITLSSPPVIGFCHAVFAINLHRFKTINATLGRDIGDELLKATVQRLLSKEFNIRDVARIGGDTFAITTRETVLISDLQTYALKVISALERPFLLSNVSAKVGAHIGVAYSDSRNPVNETSLMNNAEFALDQAKMINGSGVAFFDPSSSAKILKARHIEQELWSALDKGEITVAYQPQVELSNLKLIGVEALIRWNHPQLGYVSPLDFVEIAEANGFVENLGRWILERACADACRWTEPLTVAVNVSGLQFTRGDLVHDVEVALQKSGLPAHRLHLEITESAFLNPSDTLIDKLHELKRLGVSLALDDFGTGYSSFGYLAKFPLDKIKVDQMFVRNLINENSARAIINSVRTLTSGLNIKMICEGIETTAELEFLRNLGCEQGQGYFFGKPQSWEAIEGYIAIAA